jgi:hypothetical protein
VQRAGRYVGSVLFATLDYVQYRRQRGRCRPAVLARGGWKLAIRENFQGSEAPQPADAFLMHTRVSTLSWLVMYVTNFPGSHAGVFGYDGLVIDATTAGVIQHPFSDYLDGQSYLRVLHASRRATPNQQRDAVGFAQSQLGAPYGWAISAKIAARVMFGVRHDPSYRPHPRLWFDTLMLLGLATIPRRLFPAWPNLLVLAGPPYVAILARNRARRGFAGARMTVA